MQSPGALYTDKKALERDKLVRLEHDVANLTASEDPVDLIKQLALDTLLIVWAFQLIGSPCSKVSVENTHELNPPVNELGRQTGILTVISQVRYDDKTRTHVVIGASAQLSYLAIPGVDRNFSGILFSDGDSLLSGVSPIQNLHCHDHHGDDKDDRPEYDSNPLEDLNEHSAQKSNALLAGWRRLVYPDFSIIEHVFV